MALYTDQERFEFESSMKELMEKISIREGLDMETAAATAVMIKCFGIINKEEIIKLLPAMEVFQEISNEDIDEVQAIELAMTLSKRKHLLKGLNVIKNPYFEKDELREISDVLCGVVVDSTGKCPRKSYVDSLIRARNAYQRT